LRFEHLKSLHNDDEDFGELYLAYKKCSKEDFLIQEGWYLFKDILLYIPKCGRHELLIKEIHGCSLIVHYGENKTSNMLKEFYYGLAWLKTFKTS